MARKKQTDPVEDAFETIRRIYEDLTNEQCDRLETLLWPEHWFLTKLKFRQWGDGVIAAHETHHEIALLKRKLVRREPSKDTLAQDEALWEERQTTTWKALYRDHSADMEPEAIRSAVRRHEKRLTAKRNGKTRPTRK